MIGRSFWRDKPVQDAEPQTGFDAFELRLGDTLRGERATMGKSLLDVQRELKIKAAYVAAIENCDPTAFDTPGFIAGYVRSYARYLNMDPDWAFDTFCAESGFATAHGMSAEASSAKPSRDDRLNQSKGNDIFSSPATPFVPAGDAFMANIEPRAIGSVLVLVALIGGLGYGGYSVLQEVQRVQFAPVEQTPTVVSELHVDPLAGGGLTPQSASPDQVANTFTAPSSEALDRLYRPQALDTPVMVARDAPIASLHPGSLGVLSDEHPVTDAVNDAVALAINEAPTADLNSVIVTEGPAPEVALIAVRPAWVRVRAADGAVIFEATMNAGDTYIVPKTEDPATLRIGESGAVFFAVNGAAYGPVGPRGQVSSNVALSADNVTQNYAAADIAADRELQEAVRTAELQLAQ